jgi:hypothetical protein
MCLTHGNSESEYVTYLVLVKAACPRLTRRWHESKGLDISASFQQMQDRNTTN